MDILGNLNVNNGQIVGGYGNSASDSGTTKSFIGGGSGNVIDKDVNELRIHRNLSAVLGPKTFNIVHNLGRILTVGEITIMDWDVYGYTQTPSFSNSDDYFEVARVPLQDVNLVYSALTFTSFSAISENEISIEITSSIAPNHPRTTIEGVFTQGNPIPTTLSNIGGGEGNRISGSTSSIIGGGRNNIINTNVEGLKNASLYWNRGIDNILPNTGNFIGGGWGNTLDGDFLNIGGGFNNAINSTNYSWRQDANYIYTYHTALSNIGGGINNTINVSNYSTIGGGDSNSINGNIWAKNHDVIVGGSYNQINTVGEYGSYGGGNFIGGGGDNYGGGTGNTIISQYGSVIVGGGIRNGTNTGNHINAGGNTTTPSQWGYNNFIGGGDGNKILGETRYSGILGGQGNTINSPRIHNESSISVSGVTSGTTNLVPITHNFNKTILASEITVTSGGSIIPLTQINTIYTGITYNSISGVSSNQISIDFTVTGTTIIDAITITTYDELIHNTILGGQGNVINGINNTHIIGSNITALLPNTTYVESLNISTTPLTSTTITDIMVRDTDGTLKTRDINTLLEGTTLSANTPYEFTTGTTTGGIQPTYSTAQGSFNLGDWSTIAGGTGHTINKGSNFSFIGGGGYNNVTGPEFSFIGAGENNRIFTVVATNGHYSSIVGGQDNIISRTSHGFIGGGVGNSLISVNGYGSNFSGILGGINNTISGTSYSSSVIGGQGNVIKDGVIRGFIGGGKSNTLEADVNGTNPEGNPFESQDTFIGSGKGNKIYTSWRTFIGGGYNNTISGTTNDSFIGGGTSNYINGDPHVAIVVGPASKNNTIVGGDTNRIEHGDHNFIGGGHTNTVIKSRFSTIGSGRDNTIGKVITSAETLTTTYSVIGGGYKNHTVGHRSFIGGGGWNYIAKGPLYGSYNPSSGTTKGTNYYSSIVGGLSNQILGNGSYNSIVGGSGNVIQTGTSYTSIVGGNSNTITISNHSIVGGGENNTISGSTYSGILGGHNNQIEGSENSVVVGGGGDELLALWGPTDVFLTIHSGNTITSSKDSFIGGGVGNTIVGGSSYNTNTIVGGARNRIDGSVSDAGGNFIGGGGNNAPWFQPGYAGLSASTIGNTIYNAYGCVIVGGSYWSYYPNSIGNTSTQINNSSIVGGSNNHILNDYSFIGGGYNNNMVGNSGYNSIIGGSNNTIGNVNHVHIIGSNLTATTSNTTYVESFNIGTIITGVTNELVGILSNGTLIKNPILTIADDDADAALSGVTVGQFYQTSGSGVITTLGVVMVKQ